MKFSFCGGLDCPDWLLAEIAAMASISAVKVKQISVKVTTNLVLNINLVHYNYNGCVTNQ